MKPGRKRHSSKSFLKEANKGASLMSLRMRIVTGAGALAALILSVTSASACCGGCGCGTGYATYYQPVTVYRPVTVYAPVQATYAVNQGPVYDVPAAVAPEPCRNTSVRCAAMAMATAAGAPAIVE
jgi:hypothetical protein